MKTIKNIICQNMILQLVEVENVKKADWANQADTVWTTFEIHKNKQMIASGSLENMVAEYNRQCNLITMKG